MDWIAEILAFYDYIESNPQITDTCICLWHALMYQAKKTGWKSEFSVAISTLELRTGLKRGAVYNARNKLRQCGLIDFEAREGNQSSIYKIHSLCSFNEHNQVTEWNTIKSQSDTQGGTQRGTQAEKEEKPPPLVPPSSFPPGPPISSPPYNPPGKEEKEGATAENTSYSSSSPPNGEFDEAVELWNSLNLTKIVSIQGKRREMLKTRLKDYGLDNFKQAIENIRKSAFLRGQNKSGFIITFDWLIKPNNFPKVLEGNYDDKSGGNTGPPPKPDGGNETNNPYLKLLLKKQAGERQDIP